MRQMRGSDADQGRPLRQVPGLLRLPGMQEHPAPGKAEKYRRRLSGMQGRGADREEVALRQAVLLLQPLPPMQVCPLGPAGGAALPKMRLPAAGEEGLQEEGRVSEMPQGRVRLAER